jgi:dihydroneopterin aldolase
VADELLRRFSAERAVVRVTKPAIRPGGVGGFAAVRISRP